MKTFYIRNVIALFIKQIKDTLKNIQVLVLYIIYPCIAYIMSTAMAEMDNASFFITIFATMHCTFTPIVATASLISEEKEKNTLRVLTLSNVTMSEYLIAIGSFLTLLTIITGTSFLFMSKDIQDHSATFLCTLLIGCLLSTFLGMCIGLQAKNASSANAMAVPFGMIFAFMPMLASFNDSIYNISKFTYGQQIANFMTDMQFTSFGLVIILINLLLLLAISVFLFKRVKRAE